MHVLITYILFFFGIFLEGELILLSAVIAAHQGLLNIWLVIVIAILATIISDLVYFNLGRHKAKKWLENGKFANKFEAVQERLVKNRNKMLFTYRFIYGMRMVTPFVLGTQDLTVAQFLKYSVISTLIWCVVFVSIGYSFGELILNNLKHFQKIEFYIIGVLVVFSVIYIIYKYMKNNKNPIE